jgi:hypothetical protein
MQNRKRARSCLVSRPWDCNFQRRVVSCIVQKANDNNKVTNAVLWGIWVQMTMAYSYSVEYSLRGTQCVQIIEGIEGQKKPNSGILRDVTTYKYIMVEVYRCWKKTLGRPRRRLLDNIRMDLVEVAKGDVDWISLARDRNRWRTLVNPVMNLRVSSNAGKLSSDLTTDGFSSSARLHRIS